MELDLITDLDVNPLNGQELYSGITQVQGLQEYIKPPVSSVKPISEPTQLGGLSPETPQTVISPVVEPISVPNYGDGQGGDGLGNTTMPVPNDNGNLIEEPVDEEGMAGEFDDGGMMGGGMMGGGGGAMPPAEEEMMGMPMARMDEGCKVMGIDCMYFYGGLALLSVAGFYYYKTKIAK